MLVPGKEVTMNSIAKSSIVFALVFGGALCGIFLRTVLPADYFGADSKDIVKLGMALVTLRRAVALWLPSFKLWKCGCSRLYVCCRSVCFRRDPHDPRNVFAV